MCILPLPVQPFLSHGDGDFVVFFCLVYFTQSGVFQVNCVVMSYRNFLLSWLSNTPLCKSTKVCFSICGWSLRLFSHLASKNNTAMNIEVEISFQGRYPEVRFLLLRVAVCFFFNNYAFLLSFCFFETGSFYYVAVVVLELPHEDQAGL